MDAFDLMGTVHDHLTYAPHPDFSARMGDEPSFKTWPELDMQEVERVGRSLATLFGITLDEGTVR
jgi:hypothetical protein